MTHLTPLARFRFDPATAVESPFDALNDGFRHSDATAQTRLDECVAMEDAAGAVVALTKLYLEIAGQQPEPNTLQRALALRSVAKARLESAQATESATTKVSA